MNLAALRVLQSLDTRGRAVTVEDQAVLGRWAGWGALAGVFDENDERWAPERAELRELVNDDEWAAARRTTLNAHYTDAGVVNAVWRAVTGAGFDGGAVLEPGCGAGNFIGLAPDLESNRFVGVELDPITGRIAQALYPQAEIRVEGFERTRFPAGSFDVAVGNVPFGDYRLVDPVHNLAGHNIHNHFIVKALDLTRPGGYVALITSRYTLDAASPHARADMYDRADLVGAVRLPAGAFRAAAGTDVICDVLVFRRREADRAPAPAPWLEVGTFETATGTVTINQFFVEHPELVAGDITVGRGQYRDEDLVVVRTDDFEARLDNAMTTIVTRAQSDGLAYSPAAGGAAVPVALEAAPAGWKEGTIRRDGPGFVTVEAGAVVAFAAKGGHSDVDEIGALVDLRDTVVELLDVQARSGDDADFAVLQGRLNERYDAYAQRWGPLNRYRLVRTGRVDPDTGEDRMRKLRPVMGGFRADADAPTVMALEHYDEETGRATKAAIFSRRVVAPRVPVTSAGTPAEALAVCLDQLGRPDLERISELLDFDTARTRDALGELVWDDPASGELVAAGTYLSGDVRAKLVVAKESAAVNSRFDANVTALVAVVPQDLIPAQIDARPGATWIPEGDVADFVTDALGASDATVTYEAALGRWSIEVPPWQRRSVAMTSEWGTERANGADLLAKAANQVVPTIYDTVEDKRVLNLGATLDARTKQEALIERFSAWVWEDDHRAERLATRYNELFNSTVVPAFNGSHLSLPGLVEGFVPHDHQRDAVWRVLSEPTVLLAHEVGAGKTAILWVLQGVRPCELATPLAASLSYPVRIVMV